jgi:hypothetical protein
MNKIQELAIAKKKLKREQVKARQALSVLQDKEILLAKAESILEMAKESAEISKTSDLGKAIDEYYKPVEEIVIKVK